MCAPARSRPARSFGGDGAAEHDHGRDRQAVAALERGEHRGAGGGAHGDDDVGRRAERGRRQAGLHVMALGGQGPHERLVAALGDDEDAPAGLGSGLHAGASLRA